MLIKLSAPFFNKHNEGFYTKEALRWRQIGAIDKAANIVEILGSGATEIKTVLEVGCGTGAVLSRLAQLGVGEQYKGIEVIDPRMHVAVEGASDPRIAFDTYAGNRIDAPDSSFDFVFASHVLEHVLDERQLLEESARVSKRLVYIEVPSELHLRTTTKALQRSLLIGHINAYTPESFALTLVSSWLRIERMIVRGTSLESNLFGSSKLKGHVAFFIRKSLLKLNETLATRLFTFHVGALCHK